MVPRLHLAVRAGQGILSWAVVTMAVAAALVGQMVLAVMGVTAELAVAVVAAERKVVQWVAMAQPAPGVKAVMARTALGEEWVQRRGLCLHNRVQQGQAAVVVAEQFQAAGLIL